MTQESDQRRARIEKRIRRAAAQLERISAELRNEVGAQGDLARTDLDAQLLMTIGRIDEARTAATA